jgi:hypothetical protein
MKIATILVLGALSPLAAYAQFSPADIQPYLGDYQLQKAYYGNCNPQIGIGIALGDEKDPSSGVLSVGDYSFPAINMGRQESGDRAGAFETSESTATIAWGRPILRNHTERVLRDETRFKREVEVRALEHGRVEMEIDGYSKCGDKGDATGDLDAKCVYVKMPNAPEQGPKQGPDQGQQPDQGKGQGQGPKQGPDQGQPVEPGLGKPTK